MKIKTPIPETVAELIKKYKVKVNHWEVSREGNDRLHVTIFLDFGNDVSLTYVDDIDGIRPENTLDDASIDVGSNDKHMTFTSFNISDDVWDYQDMLRKRIKSLNNALKVHEAIFNLNIDDLF